MRLIIGLFFGFLLFLTACAPSRINCPADAKLCPDGSSVGRALPNCEFAQCPSANISCDYDNPDKQYIQKNPEQCQVIRYLCVQGKQPFSDECGCGCKTVNATSGKLQAFDCTPEQKKADVCIELYKPVCGWFDPAKIQCVKYPCAAAYSNSCFACKDEKVISWTEGQCPQ